MKETATIHQDKIEITKETEKKYQLNYVGSIKNLNKGQTLFEFDTATLKIVPATFESTEISFADASKGNVSKRKKVIIKQGCLYIPALNVSNVIKKLTKPKK